MGVVTRAKKGRLEEDEERLGDHISHLPDAVLGDIACRSDSSIPNPSHPHGRPPLPAVAVLTRAKKTGLEQEDGRFEDQISRLPDEILGDIVSLLATKDGARTQVLSSRWRDIWRSAPLNVDLTDYDYDNSSEWLIMIPCILSSHPGPGRRFAIHRRVGDVPVLGRDTLATTLDGWLHSPALHSLQQLEFHHWDRRPPLPAPSVHRFSSTLRIASFGGFRFPDEDGSNASALRLPLLQQLTLVRVTVSEASLRSLLAGLPALESLLLLYNDGFRRLRVVSRGWACCRLRVLVIEDAPCLERLLFFQDKMMEISVISAPRLQILGKLLSLRPILYFGTTKIQMQPGLGGSITEVVRSVKVLALSDVKLFLDPIINLTKCFPHLETLYIKTTPVEKKNAWCRCRKYQKLTGTADIRLRKIVLANYLGNYSHVNFAKFFVSKARLLESMTLQLGVETVSDAWIEEQHRLLQIEKRASKLKFVSPNIWNGPLDLRYAQQVHDLSTDPFQNVH